MSFLIALSIILTRVLSLRIPLRGVERFRLGFGGFPIIFAGILFGPAYGTIVGVLADIQGYFITPTGGYLPHFTITSGLTGFIPGFLFYYFSSRRKTFTSLAMSIGIGQLCTSVLMVPFIHYSLFGIPIKPLILINLLTQVIIVILYALLCRKLLDISIFKNI